MDPYGNKIRSVLHPKDWRNTNSQQAARSPLFGPKPGVPGPCPPGYTDVTKGDLYKTGRVCQPPGGVKQ
jgi:hypothetical protein